MRYEIPVLYYGPSAKNKAIICDIIPPKVDRWIILEAKNDEDAWNQVQKTLLPNIKKPIAGRSYIRHSRVKNSEDAILLPMDYPVGTRVKLHTPYRGFSSKEFTLGTINEQLSKTLYCITLDGYDNPYVDFSTREFSPVY